MDVQALGLADALGVAVTVKHVSPKGLTRLLAPYAPLVANERLGRPGSPLQPPWPELAIATGRLSIPYLRALAAVAGPACFRVVLQDPKMPASIADLIWVPEHDRRRGANVFTTLTPPHALTPERLAGLRAALPTTIKQLPSPRATVVLGGPNAVYPFRRADFEVLARRLGALSAHVASFLVTPSRRSPPELVEAVREAIAGTPSLIWNGAGENPYAHMLAAADLLVVTGDSVNMTGEACATGRPVYVFEPAGGSPKFNRFHEALRRYGATRPLPERIGSLEGWSYQPLHSTGLIAREVERRWLERGGARVAG